MAHLTNINAFLLQANPNYLFDSYRLLVVAELALKDAGYFAGVGGHDVPAMLARASADVAAKGQVLLSGQINSLQAKLHADLGQLLTTKSDGTVQAVPPHSYPHARYTRCTGDWKGTSETVVQALADLAQTCHGLVAFLRANKAALGVQL